MTADSKLLSAHDALPRLIDGHAVQNAAWSAPGVRSVEDRLIIS
jgi:hypothetical protein